MLSLRSQYQRVSVLPIMMEQVVGLLKTLLMDFSIQPNCLFVML